MIKTSKTLKWFAFCWFMILGLFLLSACAPPVPQKTAQKNCLDCHSEYKQKLTKGVVHKPVQEEKCNTCHRTHGQIGGSFLRDVEPDLCFRCHRQFANNLQQFKSLHAPVGDGKCQECHSPHNSANKNLLMEKGELLCFKCHSREPFNRKNVHPPLTQGCNSCHNAHGSAAAGLLELPKDKDCASSNEVGAQAFIAKHGGFPVTNNCLECHLIHSSDQVALLKTRVHDPVAELDCSSCHESTQSGGTALVSSAGDLCFECHGDLSTSGEDVHAPVVFGECLECHSPHASEFAGMISLTPETLCFKCHEFNYLGPEPKKPGKGSTHKIVAEGGCQSCHLPHQAASGQTTLLKAPAKELCLECHAEMKEVKTVTHPPALEGLCMTCHQSHESEFAGLLIENQQKLCSQCHEIVTEDMGKLSLHRPFSKGQCSACHNPHGSSLEKLMTGPGAQVCDSCHQKQATERQNNSRHSPFTEGQCASCHAPHSSDQPALLSAPVNVICLDCHDDKKPVEAVRNRHENCISCHAPHGNEGDYFLVQSLPGLCLNCHSVDTYWEKGVGHQPAQEGECVSCHDPHFSDINNIVQEGWGVDLCGKCHDVDNETLKRSHKGITPGAVSCQPCHDPHGGPDRALSHPIKHEPFSAGDCIICHTEA